MSLATAKINIVGTRPLLWHAYNPSSMMQTKKPKRGTPGYDPDEWHDHVLCDEDGHLFVRNTYFFGALRNAGKYTKDGARGSLMSKVAGTIQVSAIDGSDKIYVNRYLPADLSTDENEEVYLDIRGVVVQRNKHVRSRVATRIGWEIEFILMWENSVIGETTMEAIVNDAGLLVGIGDGRQIGYGRFEVVKFKLQ